MIYPTQIHPSYRKHRAVIWFFIQNIQYAHIFFQFRTPLDRTLLAQVC